METSKYIFYILERLKSVDYERKQLQYPEKINVWDGILANNTVGPFSRKPGIRGQVDNEPHS